MPQILKPTLKKQPKQMNNYDEASKARFAALFYLSKRMLTSFELRQKLMRKEYSPEICDSTIAYMEELGYINDKDYAELYTKNALENKKHGLMRIRQELQRRGIEQEVINEMLSSTETDNGEALKSLIKERSQRLDLSDRKQKDRLVGWLVRRGYRFDEIYSALRELELEDIEFD